jgi:hypothetical protein
VVVDRGKPRVGELAQKPGLRGLHDVQHGGGVVEDYVDEGLEVCKAERGDLSLSSWLRAVTRIGRNNCKDRRSDKGDRWSEEEAHIVDAAA